MCHHALQGYHKDEMMWWSIPQGQWVGHGASVAAQLTVVLLQIRDNMESIHVPAEKKLYLIFQFSNVGRWLCNKLVGTVLLFASLGQNVISHSILYGEDDIFRMHLAIIVKEVTMAIEL